jgi:hypoxanthine phosphoribosyltransferase
MLTAQEARRILERAELIISADVVSAAVVRVAAEITARLGDAYPLVLSVMGGAVVFTGNLLPLLRFPVDFDYLHVTRYGDATRGGALRWIAAPRESIAGRTVLVLDDILDEGVTLAAIKQRLLDNGAKACFTAVFADKDIGRPKPIAADFVGVRLPNRYVFGFGMDVKGAWRNLPAIYALEQS